MSLPVNPITPGSVTPVGVKTGTKAERESAATAMAFERMLIGELTKVLADPKMVTAGQEVSGATNMMLGQMPEVLADSLSKSGGIGLAAALQPALEGGAR